MRTKTLVVVALALALPSGFASGADQLPLKEIAGINLRMDKDEVMRRLGEIGKFVRREEGEQEAWEIRDPEFSHVIVGFGREEKLRYITAVARTDKDARRVSYAKVGQLKDAKQVGDVRINNFQYEWTVPKKNKQPAIVVLAMGRDPEFLSTLTLKNPEVEKEKERD